MCNTYQHSNISWVNSVVDAKLVTHVTNKHESLIHCQQQNSVENPLYFAPFLKMSSLWSQEPHRPHLFG